ncbi:glycosyltransferase [Echinicola vietnamensis]|uniref:Glycosyltransferase n=1 Tax=Echinicola vietnamensis (strain DSM 17526 / LMG 23754 / KMM 6221) TaxID=926556 RepID=L0G3Y9_ECHVK|nr:glycosyltransferase [Echinicola vietnamensis]AGA80003.1 glycosyltransferase [Echinicola vietnamensis DSM 17526]
MKLLYLSGAPRVSTQLKADAGGARAHILGVINGFKSMNWEVAEFIVGNRIMKSGHKTDFQKSLSKSFFKRLAADLIRITYGMYNNRLSFKKHTEVDCVYERLGAFQLMGHKFRKHGVPWILETNSVLYEEAKNDRKSIILSGICKKMEAKAYQSCDYLICVTDELKAMVLDHFDIDPAKILVVPNGVDTDRFDPERVTPIREHDEFTIGFVGSVIAWCGVDVLIRAVDILKDEIPLKVTVVGDGLKKQDWETDCANAGLSDTIKFVGRKAWDQIPGYIGGFDVCYSGQVATKSGKMYHSPLKIYEYLSMGKPVLAAKFQDASNMIHDGVNGFCFKSGDVDDLVEKIRTAYGLFKEGKFRPEEIRRPVVTSHSWKSRIEYILKETKTLN